MAISHVLRAEEHLSNTPRQIMLYEALGYAIPEFAHMSLILNPDRTKMSKRSGEDATFVSEFRARGYLPEALLNFLVLLGWSWDGRAGDLHRSRADREVLDRPRQQHGRGVRQGQARVDERPVPQGDAARSARRTRARVSQGDRWRARREGGRRRRRVPRAGDRGGGGAAEDAWRRRGYAGFAFRDPVEIADDARAEFAKRPEGDRRLRALADAIEPVDPFELEPLEGAVRALAETMGVKAGDLFFPARVA
jgi:nondiscriminating glutamyl-tRNA synthetase